MAITILNKKYTDQFGNVTTYWQSNAGDPVTVEYKVIEQIFVVSGGQNFFTFDFINNTITWSGGDWLKEGLRVGEIYQIRKFDNTGSAILITAQTVINVSGPNNSIVKFDDLNPNLAPDVTLNQQVGVMGFSDATDYRKEELIINVNQIQSNGTPIPNSPIDGEVTKFKFNIKDVPGFPNPANGLIIQGVPIGKQSGQFKTTCEIEFSDETPAQAGFYINIGSIYYIRFKTINSGIYLPSFFNLNQCIKIYAEIEGVRLFGEPFNHSLNVINDDANTGYYDEPFNIGTNDAVLVQGITEISYDAPTNAQIIFNTPTPVTDIGLGCSYIPGDEDYYKNQNPNQSVFGMTIETTPLGFVNNVVSPTNPDGANYVLDVTAISNTGSVITIDLTITPNAQFDAFIGGREIGDQTFYVWAKVGDVNFLVFNGQLTSNPPIGGPLQLETAGYYDHGQNIDAVKTSVESGYEANVEDDLAFVGSFLLNVNDICETFLARIEAFNTVTDETFTLAQTFFSFAGVPQIAGKYILNQTSNVYSILPTTSLKRDAKFVLEPSLDTPTQYGVKIYFPFIYRWEYWLQQTNANNDFFPNDQTKNWVPYGTTGDWTLRLHLELNREGLGYVYDDNVIIKDYDSDRDIKQNIELFINATNQLANIVTIGQLMRVEATHELIDGQFWETPSVWGQITVEPTESATRYLLSTTVPFDNNINNPLTPISGQFLQLTFPTPSVAKMVCYFDPGKINLNNGCKFTTKIKGCTTDVLAFGKVTTEDEPKVTTDDILKEIS